MNFFDKKTDLKVLTIVAVVSVKFSISSRTIESSPEASKKSSSSDKRDESDEELANVINGSRKSENIYWIFFFDKSQISGR